MNTMIPMSMRMGIKQSCELRRTSTFRRVDISGITRRSVEQLAGLAMIRVAPLSRHDSSTTQDSQ
jgi:hypothetical protein